MNNDIDETQHDRKVTLLDIVNIIWQFRKRIVRGTAIVTVCMLLVSLLLPKYYRAETTILPANSETSMMGNFSSIASLAGISLNETPLQDLIPPLINSETVLKEVIYASYFSHEKGKMVNLVEYWDIDDDSLTAEFEAALKIIRGTVECGVEKKSGIVTVSMLMKEPQLAADVVNKIATVVDFFLRERRMTNASEQRKWIESRIREVEKDLRRAENRLEDFRKANRSISNSPELQIAQQRILRETEINSTLYVELRKQFELARIEEVKNISVLTIIDTARPAFKKEKPKRAFIVVMSMLIGFLVISAFMVGSVLYKGQILSFVRQFKK